MVIGTVIEPNVFFEVGKVDFGPLLINGRNKEIVRLKNLEEVPISFNFDRESIKGEGEYANSLHVHPTSGTIRPLADVPIEIVFEPNVE
jgi:hydrocephalus-inducing protein